MKIICFSVLFFFFVITTTAQAIKKTDQQTLGWIRYYATVPLADNWDLNAELDNRSFLNPVHQNVFVVRVQARYRINQAVEIGGGFAYFNVNTQNPHVDPDYSVPDYRGQQDVTFINEVAKIRFHNRFQLEERFIQKAGQNVLLNEFSFAMRFRYRLQATFTLWEEEKQNLKGILSDEIMFNYGKDNQRNTFDQNRIYGALRYHFNPNIELELGYLKNFQRRASGVDFYDRDIIRLTIYHKFDRKPKD